MKQWQGLSQFGLALLLTGPILCCAPAQAVENLAFKGTLVNAPCTLRPGDEAIELNFGTLVNKFLYSNTRTPSQPFSLHLDDCDTAVATGVKLTFIGTENSSLPGLLALDASSVARGVAVGMETGAGQALPLNVQGSTAPLTQGNMAIALQAYVQAEPIAKANLGIVPGAFTATATFALEYQ
ncbi:MULTISPECIES: fimbrial protein [unclassified Serratia (in: enterobacteria)]|uniref:fimbrial protein n=1 Tax=unclassified Serratia (in: enterobacteria) TaxID=2647522 RepID=UPI000468ADCC|nr:MULTISPECIES: fimbrial protein [unclassified Serratia (in: enterobacteria)]